MYLGKVKAGATLFYAGDFHNDTGTLEDPTSAAARLRNTAGSWSDMTAPAKQDSKTGCYGGTLDTTGYTAGQYAIRLSGTVATAKNVAVTFFFEVEANNTADVYGIVTSGTYGNSALKTLIDDVPTTTEFNARSTADPATATNQTTILNAVNDVPTVSEILAGTVESTLTLKQVLRILLAANAGKTTGSGTANVAFRDVADAKARISAVLSDGNRTSVTLDGTD